MERAARVKPERLAEKLLRIRNVLGISQNDMLSRSGVEGLIDNTKISGYERGEREPPLPLLQRYADVAGVWVDVLIKDELDLPSKLPCAKKHESMRSR